MAGNKKPRKAYTPHPIRFFKVPPEGLAAVRRIITDVECIAELTLPDYSL